MYWCESMATVVKWKNEFAKECFLFYFYKKKFIYIVSFIYSFILKNASRINAKMWQPFDSEIGILHAYMYFSF